MARSVANRQDGRQRLAGILRALLIAQLTISLIMVIYCYNISYKVMSLLKQMHKISALVLYGLILLQAYCMKLQYTSGFRIITWLVRCPYWPRAGPVTSLWLVSGTLLAANGLLVHAACKITVKALIKELSSSLHLGLSQYLIEPKWKRIIDTMQIELNCCGVDHPEDWHEVSWINIDFLNEDSELVMKLSGADGKLLLSASPYSCCSPYILGACFHDPFQQSPNPATTISVQGCVPAAREPLRRAATALHVLVVLSFVLQLLIVLVTHLLRKTHNHQQLESPSENQGMRWRSFPYLSQ